MNLNNAGKGEIAQYEHLLSCQEYFEIRQVQIQQSQLYKKQVKFNLYWITFFIFKNLGEAEYVVAMFMYMRLLGYPAEKISILTTYNGQKHLIRDVVNQRCSKNQFIGRPHTVSIVFLG